MERPVARQKLSSVQSSRAAPPCVSFGKHGMNLAQHADRLIVAKFNGYDDFRVSCDTIRLLRKDSAEHGHTEAVRVQVMCPSRSCSELAGHLALEVAQRSTESILTRWMPAEDDASFKQDHSSWHSLVACVVA